MANDWSPSEARVTVADYFDMLAHELEHRPYNKTVHRNALRPRLNQRSNGSIEWKHQNISAVLAEMGLPYLAGYKPRSNFQDLLIDEVSKYLEAYQTRFELLFQAFANETLLSATSSQPDFAACIEQAPTPEKKEKKQRRFRIIKINYLEREQNNRTLGAAGEEYILDYEKWRLEQEGRQDLIPFIEWTAKDKGDGAGYDILSKNIDGSDRYIEVKTTKLSKETPIYLTYTEIAFAELCASQFYLYRIFNFDGERKFFIRQGSYNGFCQLQPISYKGVF